MIPITIVLYDYITKTAIDRVWCYAEDEQILQSKLTSKHKNDEEIQNLIFVNLEGHQGVGEPPSVLSDVCEMTLEYLARR